MNGQMEEQDRNQRGELMRHTRGSLAGSLAVAVAAVIIVALVGCSDLLDPLVNVDAHDRITASSYEVPENVATMTGGMVADFECALGNYVLAAGIAGDEVFITNSLTAPEMLDKRQWETRGLGASWGVSTCDSYNEATPPIYRPLSTARWQADNLLNLLNGWTDTEVPDRALYIAKAAAYAGYALTLLGEAMCEVPVDVGAAQQPSEIFALAEDRFSTAISSGATAGAPAAEFVNMARMGMARARLDAGDVAGAAQAARDVPPGFVKYAQFSAAAPRRYNQVYDYLQGTATTIDPAYRSMQFDGVDDPRVPVVDRGTSTAAGSGQLIEVWDQTKYPTRDTYIPIARYTEAQLIVAEAYVGANDLPAAVAIINDLHVAAGLPPFSSSNAAEIMNQIIYERRAELFLESQRFGDIRRYNVPLVPVPGTAYPNGGDWQDARCFPIPGIETDANPNVS
jgi:hypothetical protein